MLPATRASVHPCESARECSLQRGLPYIRVGQIFDPTKMCGMNSDLQVQRRHACLRIPHACDDVVVQYPVDPLDVAVRQMNLRCGSILIEPRHAAGTGDRHDVLALM